MAVVKENCELFYTYSVVGKPTPETGTAMVMGTASDFATRAS